MKGNVLIVRPGALGDTILSIPLIRSIQREFPDSSVTFMGNGAYRDVLPPEVKFADVGAKKFAPLFQEAGPMEDVDLETPYRAYLILKRPEPLMSNLKELGAGDIRWADSTPTPGVHMVEKLHGAFGLRNAPRKPCLDYLRPESKQDLVWMHPGSGGRSKCVDLGVYLALARFFRDAFGWEIGITKGPADQFLESVPLWPAIVSERGIRVIDQAPLKEVCGILGGARFFVGNDSGVSHLAAGLGVRALLFFRASDPVIWAPWVSGARLIIWDARLAGDVFHREIYQIKQVLTDYI
jgi:ADP-heptose:LPS heptosyltransferase